MQSWDWLKRKLCCVGVLGLAALPVSAVQAYPIEMQVYKSVDAQTSKCPDKVTVNEQSRPYREGGYTIDGSANLSWLADAFTIASSDDFSVTWVGKLKPQYKTCKGTAGVLRKAGDSKTYTGSHVRMRFVEGKAYLIVDMTGKSDVNLLTPAIVEQSVKNGNPAWTWAGTD